MFLFLSGSMFKICSYKLLILGFNIVDESDFEGGSDNVDKKG
jgi:hypothetical protein